VTVEGQVSGSEEALRTSPSRVALVRDHTSASLARLRLAGAAPPASRGSSLGSLGRLLAMRKKNPVRSDVYPCLSSGRGARSLPGGRRRAPREHTSPFARRAGARSLRAPASRGFSLAPLGRLLAMRKFRKTGSSVLFALVRGARSLPEGRRRAPRERERARDQARDRAPLGEPRAGAPAGRRSRASGSDG